MALEIAHSLRAIPGRPHNRLQNFAARAAGYDMSSFICTRADPLSGDVARIFGLSPAEAVFVDRILPASVIISAGTVCGEELLPHVRLLPVRRFDVFKSLFSLLSSIVMSAAAFPLLPDATKHAMGVLKHSLHSCYFCYHLRGASLEREVEFFQSRLGWSKTLAELLERRRTGSRSFAFVLRCMPVLVRLHLRTSKDNRFPLDVRWSDRSAIDKPS